MSCLTDDKDDFLSARSSSKSCSFSQEHVLEPATGPATADSDLAVALDVLHIQSSTQTGCSTATMRLIKHAESNGGLQSLDHIEGNACIHLDEQHAATLQRLITAARHTLQTLHRVGDDSGWHVVSDIPMQMKLMYKHNHGSPVHCVKTRVDLTAPIENMTAVFAEFDLIKTWNKQMAESAILKQHSMTGMLCLLSCWLPWPFSNVDLIVDAVGLNFLREKQRCLFLTFQTPQTLPEDVLPPSHKANSRLRVLPGSYFHYQPLPPRAPGKPPRVRCCIEALIEPDMHMPSFLVSFVLQVLAPFFFSSVSGLLKRAFRNNTDPLPKRMMQNPALYDIIRSSAKEAMADQEGGSAGHA